MAEGDNGGDYGAEEDDGGEGGLEGLNVDPAVMQGIQALMSNPSFPMIRQRMLQDPNFSAQFLQQLQNTQPQIYQAFQQNPSLLMTVLLGHDPTQALAGGAGMMGGMGNQNPPGTLSVSPQEMEAIERLSQLGFPKSRAAEAYFACDKNEEMAANFLFESGAEDEELATQNAIAAS
jgi:UV excision repair protein RAD23